MKRVPAILLATFCVALAFSACLATFNLSDVLPALMDAETQYPYVEKIVVTKLESGEFVEFTEGIEHDEIRMQFEEIHCVRSKEDVTLQSGYSVRFITTDGSVEVQIPTNEESYRASCVYIDGYRYDFVNSGVDQTFFASMFLPHE